MRLSFGPLVLRQQVEVTRYPLILLSDLWALGPHWMAWIAICHNFCLSGNVACGNHTSDSVQTLKLHLCITHIPWKQISLDSSVSICIWPIHPGTFGVTWAVPVSCGDVSPVHLLSHFYKLYTYHKSQLKALFCMKSFRGGQSLPFCLTFFCT